MPITCPGGAPTPNEPTTTQGITVTPAVPQPIYSSNATDPFPLVSWPPANEYCSFQFTATPGNQLVVPTTQWNTVWTNQDLTTGADSGANPAIAAGFGVPASAGTPVTGPASSGPIVIGTNTVTFTIVSGTIRVSMPNGSLFGYEPGDPVSNAVVKVQWANPIHNLNQQYFDNGVNQTPTGLTNYQTSLASNAPPAPTAACSGAGAVTATTATLNGSYGNADPSDKVDVLWGTTPGGPYPSNAGQTAVLPAGSGPVSDPATGLLPNTTYHYVTVVYASDGTTVLAQSAECQFTTPALPPPPPPAVLSVDCTNVVTGPWTATLKGTLLSVLSPGPAQTLQFLWTDGTNTFLAPATPIGVSGAPQAVSAAIDHLVGCNGYSYFLRFSDGTNVVDSAPCHFTAAGLFLRNACQ